VIKSPLVKFSEWLAVFNKGDATGGGVLIGTIQPCTR
jgi:hypothetical protein